MGEFEIIQRFFTRPVKNKQRFPLGVGDDSALISTPKGYDLATSIDTLAADVHFPANALAEDIGYKSLAVSLSDLAAMGAEPIAVLLALTIPHAEEAWLHAFSSGFFSLAEEYEVELIGGNMTRGPLSVSTVTYGFVPAGQALLRSRAQVGDDIYVTGHLGDASLALEKIQKKETLTPLLHQRFFRPLPRIAAGLALRNLASAAIDISDGLAADLSKLLEASRAGGCIQAVHLPLSTDLQTQCPSERAMILALSGGEDYELCFTAPPAKKSEIKKTFADLACSVQRIGQVETESGLRIIDARGQCMKIPTTGYRHF